MPTSLMPQPTGSLLLPTNNGLPCSIHRPKLGQLGGLSPTQQANSQGHLDHSQITGDSNHRIITITTKLPTSPAPSTPRDSAPTINNLATRPGTAVKAVFIIQPAGRSLASISRETKHWGHVLPTGLQQQQPTGKSTIPHR